MFVPLADGAQWAATPRRFAMVTTFYPPYSFGGDATYLFRLVNALAAAGHTVDVVHCADSYRILTGKDPAPGAPNHPNVTVHTLRSRFGALSPLLTQQTGYPWLKERALREVLVDAKPDVIHFHNLSLVGGPGALGIGNAIKLYTTHEHWLVCPMHVLWKFDREPCEQPSCLACQIRGKRPPQLWRATGMLDRALDQVDLFIAPSRFTMEMHRRRGLAGRPFAHLPYFVPPPERIPEPHVEARPYYLFVGRLEKIKGLHELLHAWEHFDRADLLVAGTGGHEAELRAQAASNPRVRFLGRLDHDTLDKYYRGAVAVVVPSICFEVFGIILLEGFAVGTPAIVNNLGALPEVIEQSGGGLAYSSPQELVRHLNTLLDNRALRDSLGESGRQTYLREWTTDAHLRQYFDICARIAEKRGE